MNHSEMVKRIALLESMNDQLLSEIQYLDELSKKLGFEKGLKSLKSAAHEMLEEMDDKKPPKVG